MDKIISIAPMMDWTDRHCRYFHRLLAPSVWLYTEMVTANALIHGDVPRLLSYDESEHPVVLQLGGSEADALKRAVEIANPYAYDEINLNCGCPSDRVQSGAFGACLMAEPQTVANCIQAMQSITDKPVTVKCRIGIDDADEDMMLREFVRTVADAGGKTFIIHARKAWLKGLSPKENRDIPPLNYELVKLIKAENPHLNIQINGGFKTIDQINDILPHVDGVMIGREAYQNPAFLVDLERAFYNPDWQVDFASVIDRMADYINAQNAAHGTPVKSVTRHMVNLFQGVQGARKWRQIISEESRNAARAEDVLTPAYNALCR